MNTTENASGQQQWTLADFLCTYRYWALFLAWLLAAVAAHGFGSLMPLISSKAALSVSNIGIFFSGTGTGWFSAAFLAFVVAGRSGKAALIWPMAFAAVMLVIFLSAQSLATSPLFLFLLGVSLGTLPVLFPLATAVFLVAGRPSKIDFACAMVLLSVALLLTYLWPVLTALFYDVKNVAPLTIATLVAIIIAIGLIAPAKHIAFDDAPRQRHQPLAPRRRAPVLVAVILMAGPILWLALAVGAGIFGADVFMAEEPSAAALLFSLLLLVVSIAVVVYFVYWVYRIHGELAGAQASQRLVSPLPAVFIALLVPLGLPVLIMTLGELLNDRAAEREQRRPISIGWLAFWAFFMPPISIAMIQNAANRSYTTSASAA